MATVQHDAITDPYIHEPKGAAAAAANTLYIADGAASGAFQKLYDTCLDGIAASPTARKVSIFDGVGAFSSAWVGSDMLTGSQLAAKSVAVSDGALGWTEYPPVYGQTYFNNPGTPYTWTYSATYTIVQPTTVAGGFASQITEATTARLTYTGTPTRAVRVKGMMSIKQSSGASKDITVAIYKNGSAITGCENVITTTSAEWADITIEWIVSAATNDYFELYMKNGGGSGNVDVGDLQIQVHGIV